MKYIYSKRKVMEATISLGGNQEKPHVRGGV